MLVTDGSFEAGARGRRPREPGTEQVAVVILIEQVETQRAVHRLLSDRGQSPRREGKRGGSYCEAFGERKGITKTWKSAFAKSNRDVRIRNLGMYTIKHISRITVIGFFNLETSVWTPIRSRHAAECDLDTTCILDHRLVSPSPPPTSRPTTASDRKESP